MAGKKRTKAWINRSRAAKRGWVTRREKQTLESILAKKTKQAKNATLGVSKKKSKKVISRLPSKKKGRKTVEQLEEIIARKDEEIRILTLTKDWVYAMPEEYLHPDGTIALQPSRARHLGEVTEEARVFMRRAHKRGELELAINELAGFLDLPIREIWTLWYSP